MTETHFRSNIRLPPIFSIPFSWVKGMTLLLFFMLASPLYPSERSAPSPSQIVRVTDPRSVQRLEPHPERVKAMLERALRIWTGASNSTDAWKKIVSSSKRVGIKIHSVPGPIMSPRPALIEAVIQGLASAGISRDHIIIFDRHVHHMENAGYTIGRRPDGVLVTATVTREGYDPSKSLEFMLPGQLVWGDLLFKKSTAEDDQQLSNRSHFSAILTQRVDCIINIGVPIEDSRFGIYGCMLSGSMSMVDNHRRFERPNPVREEGIIEILKQPILREKTRLHIMDGLIAQYAGGPSFDPQYCWPLQTLLLGNDPVAMDTLMLEEINRHRPDIQMAPLENHLNCLKAAEEAGLGNTQPRHMSILEFQMENR